MFRGDRVTANLLRQLSEAKGHIKKAYEKLDVSHENDTTDQYIYNAQVKAASALASLDRALQRLSKGC